MPCDATPSPPAIAFLGEPRGTQMGGQPTTCRVTGVDRAVELGPRRQLGAVLIHDSEPVASGSQDRV